jgi:hypothetical protein
MVHPLNKFLLFCLFLFGAFYCSHMFLGPKFLSDENDRTASVHASGTLDDGNGTGNFNPGSQLLLLDDAPLPSLLGTWTGTWEDTRYNVSGSLSFTITQNGPNLLADGIIGLASLGLGNETGTATGIISGNKLSFNFNSSTVGSGSGTITGNKAQGSGSVTGLLNFGDFNFSGTVTDNELGGTFEFTSPTGGWGVASLTKE